MSTALITINIEKIDHDQVQTVDARELHAYLGVGRDFSTWISERIHEYEFLPNRDYAIITKSGENSKRGRKQKEYALTIDMAKELAMVERNEKGRLARKYFIEAEKKYRSTFASRSSWIEARTEGKNVRKITTDIIATFIEYAKRQGSQSAEMYFMNFSKMVNAELLEIEGKKPANIRDQLNVMQLHQLSVAEQVISRTIVECMAQGRFYKDVYQDAKKRIQVYAATVGRSRIGASERQVVGLIA